MKKTESELTTNEKVKKINDLLDRAAAFSVQKETESIITCLEEAISIFSEMPFQENIGKYPVHTIYSSLAIAIGFSGEKLRQAGKTSEALEKDFRGISLMEKAIEYSGNAPKNKKIQYKKDIVTACIYVATDLFKLKNLFESLNYCEKIVKYANDIPLSNLKKSIQVLASNYDKRNLRWINQNFGEQGLVLSLQIGKKLRKSTKRFFGLF